MSSISQQIGLRMRNARKDKKISQVDLSKLTGLDQGYISRLETGALEGTPDHLNKIAAAIGISVVELIGGDSSTKLTDDKQTLSADEIRTDEREPDGLRALANDENLITAFSITSTEWFTLSSIKLPSPITKDAYVQLLLAIRAALAASSVTKS
ncbi:MAG: helix-turn-helix transcriptional regulator [Arenicellales bacterium]